MICLRAGVVGGEGVGFPGGGADWEEGLDGAVMVAGYEADFYEVAEEGGVG